VASILEVFGVKDDVATKVEVKPAAVKKKGK